MSNKLFCLSDIRATEEPTTEVEKSPVAEKEGGEDATTDAKKEAPEVEQEPEDKVQYKHHRLLLPCYLR